ncbi:hypothetical protein G6F70_005291 [Rhizopus microsporus]|nr:hypothetical protein G6F71_006809 [Rhizopus microsporus]KAG1199018.1 hypothetical protein G6F70_005291 [Rhizopus microsporus]KAG1210782.1 hypothetical protein G6F69_005170 [Rhizopus microsporus]KAG1237654.1 hypothetical protein G6F67_001055 [Rhizopus microsporus]KAG1264681.1 hypothetical protein G6F68_004153 [Rhizopus microsporus]
MKKRIRWAHKHANWTAEQWSGIIWSDESWFTVTGNDGDARVIRKVGERYEAKHIVPTKNCHTGGYARWWKEAHQIRGFEYWPAQSPDLNLIEHVWAALGKLIKERRSEIRNTEESSIVLREEWEKISPGLTACLVESTKARCEAAITSKGRWTKY